MKEEVSENTSTDSPLIKKKTMMEVVKNKIKFNSPQVFNVLDPKTAEASPFP